MNVQFKKQKQKVKAHACPKSNAIYVPYNKGKKNKKLMLRVRAGVTNLFMPKTSAFMKDKSRSIKELLEKDSLECASNLRPLMQ